MIEKHIARVAWVRSHVEDVLASVGITKRDRHWDVHEIMVTDSELLSPFVRECPVNVISFEQLKQAGIECALRSGEPSERHGD